MPVRPTSFDDPLVVTAQRDLAAATTDTCLALREGLIPEFCSPRRVNSDGTVEIRSNVALYNPLYYAAVGAPLKLLDGEAGAWAVRALGAFLSALMIAWAWALVACRPRRTRWPEVAFLVALTPAITFATSVAAPNGMSYAAGLLLWAALLSVRADAGTATAPAACAVGACVVVLNHTTGIIWVGAAVLTMLCLIGWRGIHDILRVRLHAWIASVGCVMAAMTFTVAWTVLFSPGSPTSQEPLVAETKSIPMAAHAVLWIFQTIGVMPNRFDMLWPVVYALWLVPLVLLLGRGGMVGIKRERFAGAVALGISVLIPVVATWATYEALGVAWQGRYELPLLVGILMAAGEAMDRAAVALRRLFWPIVCLVASTTYACVLCLGLREAAGPHDDGRNWSLLLWAVAPVLIGAGYLLLTRSSGMPQSSPSENADSRSCRENVRNAM